MLNYYPLQKPEKQGLIRVSPISGVSQIPAVFDSRDIRQMDVQAPPHGSLFRGNESSVRDLPLVKQN